MPLLIKEVEPWPISIARKDLQSSMALYYYAQYGLEMRELFEINGPYTFKLGHNFLNKMGMFGGMFRNEEKHPSLFTQHKIDLSIVASHQLLHNAYAVFDFFIANLIIYIYQNCLSDNKKPDDGFQFIWPDSEINNFLQKVEIASIEDDDWMEEHYKYEVLKKRISLIESSFGIKLREFNIASQSKISNWNQFCNIRKFRHSIAHNAGRKSLYSTDVLEKHNITEEIILELDNYLSHLLRYINHTLYENQIIDYKHKR